VVTKELGIEVERKLDWHLHIQAPVHTFDIRHHQGQFGITFVLDRNGGTSSWMSSSKIKLVSQLVEQAGAVSPVSSLVSVYAQRRARG
jgi:hypothetical protein